MSGRKEELVSAVKDYLAFSDENKEVESEIAEETAETMLKTEKCESGVINHLTFDKKVMFAANACIRIGTGGQI